MEPLLAAAALGGFVVYKSFAHTPEPQPVDGNKEDSRLPTPKFLYSNPAQWTSAPFDVAYRPYNEFYGPNNDPRRAHLLYGGTRVVLGGYGSAGPATNQSWPVTAPKEPSPAPSYETRSPVAIGQRPASKTVFQ